MTNQYNKPSTERVKSVLIVSSKSKITQDLSHGEETEISAQISIPTEGGWGWVVVAASLLNMFILDGITFTFGTLIESIRKDFSIPVSMAALLGSTESALYYMISPVASAIINRFGFRVCVMTGSILCSVSKLASQFCTSFVSLCVLYGWINGFGSAFINMSSSLIVGFYFQRLRTIALSITSCGTSLGIMVMSPLNNYLVSLAGWKSTVLLHSAMLGMVFFFGMTFRPLLSVTIINTDDEDINEPTRTVTILPKLNKNEPDSSDNDRSGLQPSGAERLFSAPSNTRFPTAANIVNERITANLTPQPNRPEPTTSTVSKLTLKVNRPDEAHNHLSQMQSIMSNLQDKNMPVKIITLDKDSMKAKKKDKKDGCCTRCFHWHKTVKENRPMYRDDVFYQGEIESLPAYQKSVMEIPADRRTGLEYQLAVSRAATVKDIEENKYLNGTAVRRVLASMLDPSLFKRRSFLILCFGGFVTHLGLLVPYIYIPDRGAKLAIASNHCGLFLSVVGFTSTIGRMTCGVLVRKINPVTLHACSLMLTGVSTILSTLSSNLYYQYGYCVVFGLATAGVGGIRSVMLVSLYGLEKLTNATGVVLIFLGLGTLISTPIAGAIKQLAGYDMSFYVAGGFLILSGFIFLGVKKLATAEKNEQNVENQ